MPIELGTCLIIGLVVWFAIYSHRQDKRKLRALQLSDVDNMSGHQFEHYVARLLAHQGFSTQVTVASGDLGVDVVAFKGVTKYAIQVKRQSQNVSRRAVSDAVAGKIHYKCTDSMVVTNAFFTSGAIELAKTTKCRLVDRAELTRWILSLQSGSPYRVSSPPPQSTQPQVSPSPNVKENLTASGGEYFLRNPGPVVYMLQHGNRQEYKIGFTKDINARVDQVDLQMPERIYVVHKIYTNDPRWLEAYWHKRFASKRKNGEWFDLSDEDVAEFKASDRVDNPNVIHPPQLVLPIDNKHSEEDGDITTSSIERSTNPPEFHLEVESAIARVKTHFELLKAQHPEHTHKLDRSFKYQVSLVDTDFSLWQTHGRDHKEFLANWEDRAKRAADAKIV